MLALLLCLALALIESTNPNPPSYSLRWSSLSVPSILHPLSYSLSPGHMLGILGPSGSGKSTLLTALAGILPSNLECEGDVFIVKSTGKKDQKRSKSEFVQPQSINHTYKFTNIVSSSSPPFDPRIRVRSPAPRATQVPPPIKP